MVATLLRIKYNILVPSSVTENTVIHVQNAQPKTVSCYRVCPTGKKAKGALGYLVKYGNV
jgi:hypothetical protein